jgi:hypothetical protein
MGERYSTQGLQSGALKEILMNEPIKAEDIEQVPFVYPLVRITLDTTVVVDGQPVAVHGNEIINLKEQGDKGACDTFNQILLSFRQYMKAVKATPLTPDVLQSILDKQQLDQSQTAEDSQGSLVPALEATLGNHLPGSPADSPAPETASASARTPSEGTTQEV